MLELREAYDAFVLEGVFDGLRQGAGYMVVTRVLKEHYDLDKAVSENLYFIHYTDDRDSISVDCHLIVDLRPIREALKEDWMVVENVDELMDWMYKTYIPKVYKEREEQK